MSKLSQKQRGFTIIEVVLVLAIAGLIFLIVFLALPALQRSRRDTQRRNDVGRILSNLEGYASNRNGQYPPENNVCSFVITDSFRCFWNQYDGASLVDPSSGTAYIDLGGGPAFGAGGASNGFVPFVTGQLRYGVGERCNGEAIEAGDARDAAVLMKLEVGAYCQDNR